jgi:hypothetical protein
MRNIEKDKIKVWSRLVEYILSNTRLQKETCARLYTVRKMNRIPSYVNVKIRRERGG